jgi:regulator of RNase E activity RraA
VSGTAVTVLLQPGDNWMLNVAAEQIRPGDVVVAAITADCTDGYFGDLLATSFMARGAKALIIFFSRVVQHGKRRAEEMRESAATVREAGFPPLMATVIAEKQDWVARLAARIGIASTGRCLLSG